MVPVPDHSPTDAIALDDDASSSSTAALPGRRWSAALTLVDLAPALAGYAAPLAGNASPLAQRLLARFEAPLTYDNMEGMALRRRRRAKLCLSVSDNNLNRVQRTLLMKFELMGSLLLPPPTGAAGSMGRVGVGVLATLCSLRSRQGRQQTYRGSRHIDQNSGPPPLIR